MKRTPFRISGLLILIFLFGRYSVHANNPLYIRLEKDTLYVGNDLIEGRYVWNQGNISLVELEDKEAVSSIPFDSGTRDFFLLNEPRSASQGTFERIQDKRNDLLSAHVEFSLGALRIRRVITIFKGTKAIRHCFFVKGKAEADSWRIPFQSSTGMIENKKLSDEESSRIGHFDFQAVPWQFTSVAFQEATDHHDNPVHVQRIVAYRKKNTFSANVLVAEHPHREHAFFLIKEAPIGQSQQAYPGFDFLLDHKGLSVHGLGIGPNNIKTTWVQGYGYAIGISPNDKTKLHTALLNYQKRIRPYKPERDFMVMANTWGDRSKDSRMNEDFIMTELEKAGELGITHLQLDDGWQQGLSRNSASKEGLNWDDWEISDWLPHRDRFPNGFAPVVSKANNKGINLGIWFNPSKVNSYAKWERDADILLSYYRDYGISVFKIDGMELADKASETNLGKLFQKVLDESNGKITFNMDVTAGRRMGFHFFQEYGNIFLENRYTDWGNYYPHRSLRNLWLLSAYVPAERLQIEFLNVERNQDTYPLKTVAPATVGLEYAFGTAMMAQPLAWMELTGLKDIPKTFASMITAYKKVAPELHKGTILPIGNEPNGYTWSGLLSLGSGRRHHVAVYREFTKNKEFTFTLPFEIHSTEKILGEKVGHKADGKRLKISMEQPWSFALLRVTEK